jgi:hypothetical protein
MTQRLPHRVVDAELRSWFTTQPYGEEQVAKYGEDALVYSTGRPDDGIRSYEELPRPFRRIVPRTTADAEKITKALVAAGRKALVTLAVALANTAKKHQPPGVSADVLTAGRPGSWESVFVRSFAGDVGDDVGPRRIHAEALADLEEVLGRWVASPDTYTEVAENLAAAVGQAVDEAGGFRQLADQWLLAHEGLEQIENWACYLSSNHDRF